MIISIPGQDNTFADMVTRSFSGSMWRRHCFRWAFIEGWRGVQQSACFWGQGLWKYKNPNKKVCAQKCIYKILWRRHWCGWVLKVGGVERRWRCRWTEQAKAFQACFQTPYCGHWRQGGMWVLDQCSGGSGFEGLSSLLSCKPHICFILMMKWAVLWKWRQGVMLVL